MLDCMSTSCHDQGAISVTSELARPYCAVDVTTVGRLTSRNAPWQSEGVHNFFGVVAYL